MSQCETYDPDKVFKRFQVVEFPISFVGLSTTQDLDVEMDITGTSYLKTLCEGSLMNFEDAREVSPSHRSFTLNLRNCHTLEITFTPTNECIAKVKLKQQTELGNRFVFDLRVINVEGKTCCNDERHAEVGRYYISGQYEYCNITHSPKTVDFGNLPMKSKNIRTVRIQNDSKQICAQFSFLKVTGFDVNPRTFSIPPNSSKKIEITINPNGLKVVNALYFCIRNPHDIVSAKEGSHFHDENFLPYSICVRANIFIGGIRKVPIVESLHTLYELNPKNTYLGDELNVRNERKLLAYQLLQFSKSHKKTEVTVEKFSSSKPKCCPESPKLENVLRTGRFFCTEFRPKISAPDLFNIVINPQSLNFGKVGIKTYGEQDLTIKNDTKYDIIMKFKNDKNILYTERKLSEHTIKLKSYKEFIIRIFCYGFLIGDQKDTFNIGIDNKFNREVVYKIEVGDPLLSLPTTCLKFGMATSEGFVSSIPVKIYNNYNVPIDFEWRDLHDEFPFEILPLKGTVSAHSCNICDITYISKNTKTRIYDIEFVSNGVIPKTISIEANIISRKVTLKFLQQGVIFKDIPLNMEVTELVRLENSSREVAVFHVVEPLLPGLTVEPMNGIMRPKSIIAFQIILKISCVLDFNYDLIIRVNNKENVDLPISGSVTEPKLTMSPKNVFMPRVPCTLLTYVPVTIQNSGNNQALIEILDTGDENIFEVYTQEGCEKVRINEIIIRAGQTKTLLVKVYDVFRREYDMYIPFKINGLLGPPNLTQSSSTEIGYYIGEYEKLYENNPKVKVKPIHKDINYMRILGVFTVPWIDLSIEKFEIVYEPNGYNSIPFTMTNISRYHLPVCIVTSKLHPNFSLDILTEENDSIVNETCIKFELERGKTVSFSLNFHPNGLGKFSVVALLYLDKAMSLPFYNLLFTGRRQFPTMTASTSRIIFPPTLVGETLSDTFTVTLAEKSNLSSFTCSSKEEPNIIVELVKCAIEEVVKDRYNTFITVKVTICCKTTYARNLSLVFNHECGSSCCIEICFCFTYCPVTLHVSRLVKPKNNPYPFYPLETQTDLYEYMDKTVNFLERWIFQQGFRRDLYPILPDTFHALGTSMVNNIKIKGINITLLNFMKRIAGPLMKHIHKSSCNYEEPFKTIKDINDTYKSIIHLLRSRGANLWLLQARFLLTHKQFTILSDFQPPAHEADIAFTQKLLRDPMLYHRLSKQSWIDLILQCYKVFILDSCFFDCVCVSTEPRDIEKILIDWYNEQITVARLKIMKDISIQYISNLTTDLRDGIAIISALYNHCPFLEEYICSVCKVKENDSLGAIVHNACIVMEVMNLLKLLFPLTSQDFLEPNYLHMLFLSVHLYVVLPMFRSKDIIELKPPLLRTSSRAISISPLGQEGLAFNYSILNNCKNSFSVEKNPVVNNLKQTTIFVKYTANFVSQDKAILLAHGYNKTRIFDTYMIFILIGNIGALNPIRKCKLTAPIYRPNKVDVSVHSPFITNAVYKLYVTDTEPTIPMIFEVPPKKGFCFKRLALIDNEIALPGQPKEQQALTEIQEIKVYLHLYCLNTQSESSWIWFRSEIGEFFIKVTTQARWDLAVETFLVKVQNWPMDPCSCGEACECYRSTVLTIPHRNDLMLKALRLAMAEYTTNLMINIYDNLIETTTGQVVLTMLLNEGGTKMSELSHILRQENSYHISSKNLFPHQERVTLRQHTDAMCTLPVTIPPKQKSEKFSITLTSDCGMDIRSYKILFVEEGESCSDSTTLTSSTQI